MVTRLSNILVTRTDERMLGRYPLLESVPSDGDARPIAHELRVELDPKHELRVELDPKYVNAEKELGFVMVVMDVRGTVRHSSTRTRIRRLVCSSPPR